MRIYYSGCNTKSNDPMKAIGKQANLMPSYWYIVKGGIPKERMKDLMKRKGERDASIDKREE